MNYSRFFNVGYFENSQNESSRLDRGTIFGIICAFGLVYLAINSEGSIAAFFDTKSILIVVGGTIGATLINYPIKDFFQAISALKMVFFPEPTQPQERIEKILSLATRCRREGPLALQSDLAYETDPFLRKCIELAVDDLPPEEARRILEIELSVDEERHRRSANLFRTMGTIAPAMGLIGTLIGLVQMLQYLNDPSRMGPAMALAFLATLYGAIIANILCIPLAGKLLRRSEEDILVRELTVEGMMEILNRTNPRLVEQRLFGFIAPEERVSQFG